MLWSVLPSNPQGPRPKSVTRRTALARRDALTPSERAAASLAIGSRAASVLPGAGVVALYAPKGSEVATAGLDAALRARGIGVAYPRVIPGGLRLDLHLVTIDALVPGTFGLREPAADAARVDLATITAFCVPGLAFDRTGGRVGWGRGYYDATLAAAPAAMRVGLAFECQLLDAVPAEAHDIKLHHVITELASYP